jgi:hypothetical protein
MKCFVVVSRYAFEENKWKKYFNKNWSPDAFEENKSKYILIKIEVQTRSRKINENYINKNWSADAFEENKSKYILIKNEMQMLSGPECAN